MVCTRLKSRPSCKGEAAFCIQESMLHTEDSFLNIKEIDSGELKCRDAVKARVL
ncbi:hypothetical protein SAMN04487941_1189 [Pontibacter akesuensis]|uniref:Uncharacterized protein n=1 Tax=Pontibacter akesuensis TaxID=388950 RepID=A0A1I7GQZ3_9BACT|nr:hypothetical protein SAMN04487941_1189 [Pontibacter akesuensis]